METNVHKYQLILHTDCCTSQLVAAMLDTTTDDEWQHDRSPFVHQHRHRGQRVQYVSFEFMLVVSAEGMEMQIATANKEMLRMLRRMVVRKTI